MTPFEVLISEAEKLEAGAEEDDKAALSLEGRASSLRTAAGQARFDADAMRAAANLLAESAR